jgi:hypothetical protein
MRTFVIVTISWLLSSAASAQPPSQDTASIPDFSGIWAHLTFPDVEPPLSGAEPFVRDHRGSPDPESL